MFIQIQTHKEQFVKLSNVRKVFYMAKLQFTPFLSNNALGHFEQLCYLNVMVNIIRFEISQFLKWSQKIPANGKYPKK